MAVASRPRRVPDGGRRRAALVVAGLLLAAACARPSPDDGAIGATLRLPASVRRLVVGRPVTVIGNGKTPEQALYDVRSAATLSNGDIAVADGGSAEIRIFDTSGAFVRKLGGHGEGPGQFSGLAGVGRTVVLPGDTIAAWELPRGLVTRFGPDGRVGRIVRLDREKTGATDLVGIPGRDGYVVESMPDPRLRPGVLGRRFRPDQAYVHMDSAGRLADTIAVLPGPERYTMELAGGERGVGMPAFPGFPRAAVSGDELLYTPGDSAVVRIYRLSGRLERTLRLPIEPHAVTRRFIRADQAWTRKAYATVPAQELDREFRTRGMYPELTPAVNALIAGDRGLIWVNAYSVRSLVDTTEWIGVTREGDPKYVMTLPRALWVQEIRDGHVLGVYKDLDTGVQTVRLYDLPPDGGS